MLRLPFESMWPTCTKCFFFCNIFYLQKEIKALLWTAFVSERHCQSLSSANQKVERQVPLSLFLSPFVSSPSSIILGAIHYQVLFHQAKYLPHCLYIHHMPCMICSLPSPQTLSQTTFSSFFPIHPLYTLILLTGWF